MLENRHCRNLFGTRLQRRKACRVEGCSLPADGYFSSARHMPYILQSMDGTAGFSQLALFGSCLVKRIRDSLLGLKTRWWRGVTSAGVVQPAPLEQGRSRGLGGSAGDVAGPPAGPHSSLPGSCWEHSLLCLSCACTDQRGGSCLLRRPKAHFADGSSTCLGSAWSHCQVRADLLGTSWNHIRESWIGLGCKGP